jgi:hypothetical protein
VTVAELDSDPGRSTAGDYRCSYATGDGFAVRRWLVYFIQIGNGAGFEKGRVLIDHTADALSEVMASVPVMIVETRVSVDARPIEASNIG